MSCQSLCPTCKSAGLKACPFKPGAVLALVEAERLRAGAVTTDLSGGVWAKLEDGSWKLI